MRLVIWPQQPDEWVTAIRDAAGAHEVIAPASAAEALAAAREAEGWIGRLDREMLIAAPHLRWVQSPSISLESIVFPELIDSDVTLTNMRHIYNDHIANHVLACFLAHCRDLPHLIRRQIAGEWAPRDTTVRDPAAMTVIVMGLGGIGAEVVRRLAVFGPTVIGVDPKVTMVGPEGVAELHTPAHLAELLPRADATIICAPQTPETTGLFDEALFRRMKSSALFINIGRGKIVRLAALERALAEGWIAGAALDVFEEEPLPPSSALWAMPNVIITPHTAGYGPHTEARRLNVITDNVRRFVAGEALVNVTDKARWY